MSTIKVAVGNTKSMASSTINTVNTLGGGRYEIVVDDAFPSNLEVGDLFTDADNSWDYIIESIDTTTQITIRDKVAAQGQPDESATCDYSRAYTSISSAEAAISTWASSGDTYIMELHEEGSMPLTDNATINDTTVGTSGTIKITVADGEWHEGVESGGCVLQPTSSGSTINISPTEASAPSIIVERLEISGINCGASTTSGVTINEDGASTQTTTIRNCIVRDFVVNGTGSFRAFWVSATADNGTVFENCLNYGTTRSGGTGVIYGILAAGDGGGAYNCLFDMNGTAATSLGIVESNTINTWEVKNCVCIGAANGDFFGTFTGTNNASEDGTAPGTNPLTSITPTNEFVSHAANNYNLKAGVLQGSGVDLSGQFTGDIAEKLRQLPYDRGPYSFYGDELGAISHQYRNPMFFKGSVNRG